MAQYTYTPLDSGKQIRLLHLLPGQTSDEIEIEIFEVDFLPEEQPEYEALSYVWGSTNDRRIIKICNGVQKPREHALLVGWESRSLEEKQMETNVTVLAVTQNLEIALRHLRLSDKIRVFWIDAVCINQCDSAERSAEVARMGVIYRNARQVVVWLGPETEDSTFAIETMEVIAQDVVHDEIENWQYAKHGTKTQLLQNDVQALRAMQANWVAVNNLYDRDWFRRLWIVQEITLAARAIISIGYRNMQWRAFRKAFLWIWTNIAPFTPIFETRDFNHLNFLTQNARLYSVTSLINDTKHSLCSDPRDRVYAILSLLEADCPIDIVSNYLLGHEEIYRNFTLRHIKASLDLDILRLCTMPDQWQPSWVPNLSLPCPTVPLQLGFASGESSHQFRESVDAVLILQGVHISTINNMNTMVPRGATVSEILAFCHRWEPEHVTSAKYQHGGTMLDAYLTTLIGGFRDRNVPSNFALAPSMNDCKTVLNTCIRGGQIEGLSNSQTEYLHQLQRWLPGRSFFTTTDHHIGICPADAKCGDTICVVLGCDTPLLLRSLEFHASKYLLVGECYVHDLMHCEGLLGPVPSLWERKPVYSKNILFSIWEHDEERTHEDPRLGPLPVGWRTFYLDGDQEMDEPFDSNGVPYEVCFEEVGTKHKTRTDPRLTPEALTARGIDTKEFILL